MKVGEDFRIWHERFVEYSTQVIWGRLAKQYDAETRLACLPVWKWVYPTVDMPRVKRGQTFPVRIDYDQACVIPVIDLPATVGYSYQGLGVQATGHLDTDTVELKIGTARELEQAGERAWWHLFTVLSAQAQRHVERAANRLKREVPSIHFSSTDMEEIQSAVELGERSAVLKILDRATDPTNLGFSTRADPLRVVTTHMQRSCDEAVRSHLGDPARGRRIRSIAFDLGTFDPQLVVDEYARRYPDDGGVSVDAARHALAIGRFGQGRVGFEELENVLPSSP